MRSPFARDGLAMPRRERRRRHRRARAGLIAGSAIATLLSANPAGALPVTAHHVRYRPVVTVAPAARYGIMGFGAAPSMAIPASGGPWVAMAPTTSGHGAWLVDAAGVIAPVGDAPVLGATNHVPLKAPVVGLVAAPAGAGYWMVTADGAVLAFGAAVYHGSSPALGFNEHVVSMAATPDGGGYWLVTATGQVISYGDAPPMGSAVGRSAGAPAVAIASSGTGRGYWITTADGRVFEFGDAPNFGSATAMPQGDRVAGMAATPDGSGYWLATVAGRVFAFGQAPALGSAAGSFHPPVVAIASSGSGNGFWLATSASPASPAPAQTAAQPTGFSAGQGAGGAGGIWACIRQHESGGNYATNTGNGYYGAYQFSLPTWRSVGGQGLPSQASPAEQDQRARMLQQRSGYGQWSTARSCGA